MPIDNLANYDGIKLAELIAFLQKVMEKHGEDVKVNHVEFGGLTDTQTVDVQKNSDGTTTVVFS